MASLNDFIELDKLPFSSGATSKVYKGKLIKERYDLKTGQVLAVKILEPEMLLDPNERERIRNEYKIGNKINHANLVKIYELIEPKSPNESYAIVMEYVDGKPLSKLIEENKISFNDKLAISQNIINAIKTLHDQEILHRDIKADNIIVDNKLIAKVVDFGVSRIIKNPTITPANRFLGTLKFASPQAINGLPVEKSDDIYSLGAVLYEIFTNEELFGDFSNKALLVDAIRNQIPDILEKKRKEDGVGIPYRLRLLIHKMLSKEPKSRPTISNVIDWLKIEKTGSYLKELERFHSQNYSPFPQESDSENRAAVAKCQICNSRLFLSLNLSNDKENNLWKALEKYRRFFGYSYCHKCEKETSCEITHINYSPLDNVITDNLWLR